MTLNLRLALLGLLSISATVSTDRADAAASSEPIACEQPCCSARPALREFVEAPRTVEARIIHIENSAHA